MNGISWGQSVLAAHSKGSCDVFRFLCILGRFVRRKNLPRRCFASFFRNLTWGNAALELLKGRNNVARETRVRSICAKRRTRGPSVHAYDSSARFWRTCTTWIKLLLRVLRPLTCLLVPQSLLVRHVFNLAIEDS